MLYKTVSWSLNQLTLNRYPCKDMHGNPLDRGHHGRICDCTFITCDIVGDWKWLKETFKFRHWYGCTALCHLCEAQNTLVENSFTKFHVNHAVRTNEAYVDAFSDGERPGFLFLMFFHLLMILPDYMHIVCLGIAQTFGACALFELCTEGAFGYAHIRCSKTRMTLQLRCAFMHFKDWASWNSKSHSQEKFCLGTLNLASDSCINPKACPKLKSKAFNTMIVVQWLASLGCANADDTHIRLRSTLLAALSRQWDLFERQKAVYFTDAEADLYCRDSSRVLSCSKALFMEAHVRGSSLWSLRPKHHLYKHLSDNVAATKRNPCSHWCFSDERFVGFMSKVMPTLQGVGRKHAGRRVLQRHMIRVRLHMLKRGVRKT